MIKASTKEKENLKQKLISQYNSQNCGSKPLNNEEYSYLLTESDINVIIKTVEELNTLKRILND